MSDELYNGNYGVSIPVLTSLLSSNHTFLVYHTLLNEFSENGCDTSEMSRETGLTINESHRILNKMIEIDIVERIEVKRKHKYRRIPIIRHVYKSIIPDDSKTMNIIYIMKNNEDPDKAYEKIESVWKSIVSNDC